VSAPEVWFEAGTGAGISPLDRGLHFGDGVFETVACVAHRPRFLTLHLERLSLGCRRLRLPARDPSALRARIEEAAARAERALVKVLLTRGPASRRGYAWGEEAGTCVIIGYPWPEDDAQLGRGARVRLAAIRLGENPALAGLKHCNRLEQILARGEAGAESADEALMLSSSGILISGTMTNVFLIDGSPDAPRLRTPGLDRCGVAGVMRRVVMREAARIGLPVEECALTTDDLAAAHEIFLTNARVGVWPVRSFEARCFESAPVTMQLRAHLRPLLEAPSDA